MSYWARRRVCGVVWAPMGLIGFGEGRLTGASSRFRLDRAATALGLGDGPGIAVLLWRQGSSRRRMGPC
jgi:hypothetical protein